MADAIETKTFTRQELYEMVWTTPVRRLATQFGISDVGLAKACKRHNIPTPPLGYWAKKSHGKIVHRSSLPRCDDPALASVSIGGCSTAGSRSTPSEKPALASTFFDPELGRLAEAEVRGDDPIVVADILRSPHPLVARTREGLAVAYKDRYRRDLVVFAMGCFRFGRDRKYSAMALVSDTVRRWRDSEWHIGFATSLRS